MAGYKRTIYLVDPKFQLKFAFFVTSLVFLCSLIYPIVIYEVYEKIINLAQQNGLAEASQNLAVAKSELMQLLILFQLIFTTIVFIVCIFQGHKIAGPLFKLKKFFKSIREGNSTEKLFFRKGDNFKDVAEAYNLAMEVVNRSLLTKDQKAEEIAQLVSKALGEENSIDKDLANSILRKVTEIQGSSESNQESN